MRIDCTWIYLRKNVSWIKGGVFILWGRNGGVSAEDTFTIVSVMVTLFNGGYGCHFLTGRRHLFWKKKMSITVLEACCSQPESQKEQCHASCSDTLTRHCLIALNKHVSSALHTMFSRQCFGLPGTPSKKVWAKLNTSFSLVCCGHWVSKFALGQCRGCKHNPNTSCDVQEKRLNSADRDEQNSAFNYLQREGLGQWFQIRNCGSLWSCGHQPREPWNPHEWGATANDPLGQRSHQLKKVWKLLGYISPWKRCIALIISQVSSLPTCFVQGKEP